eukprot:TRINITY_DN11856_c0_g1_i1.p1 TRINITY_DN11856_c0_g1~~TRINITY_DN11856_c0_g1_i1.p1  ORF type:complete len:334 (-),score=33.31 TRINITY_DN11856_c0_g1_i1:77-1078(-)
MKQKEYQRHVAEKARIAQRRQVRANRCMGILKNTLFSRVGDYLTVFFLLLGVIFVPLKLDRIINWNWGLVLIPWYLLLFQFALTLLTYDLSYLYYRRLMNFDSGGWTFLFWKLIFRKRFFRDVAYCCMIAFTIFMILLTVRLTSNDPPDYEFLPSVHWWAIFIPIWILLSYVLLLPCTGGMRNDLGRITCSNCCERLGFFTIILVVLVPTILFIFLWLEGAVQWPLWLVFIPFWIMFGILVCAGTFFGIWYCCEPGGRLTFREMVVAYTAIFLFFGSFFTFFVTLSLYVSQSHTGLGVKVPRKSILAYIPIIFWAAGTLIGCLVADIYVKFFR